MAQQKEKYVVDGDDLQLSASWASDPKSSVFGFLADHAPKYPWFVGIAAIAGIVILASADHSPSVLVAAILSIAAITVVSTWKRNEHEFESETKLGRESQNTVEVGEPAGQVGQRITFGSDPPIGPSP